MALALVFGAGVHSVQGMTEAADAPAGALPAAQAAVVVKAVDSHYNHLRSLRTQFTETYDGMGMHKAEAGTLLLAKPGRMRWSYTEPKGKVFVLDGKFAWSYSPGDAQAQRIPAKQMDDLRSPLRLLLGRTELQRELTGLVVTPAGGGYVVSGVPQGEAGRLRTVRMEVTAAGQIQSLRLEETDGAVTAFAFSGAEENVPVRPDDFVFTPPMGIPVVEGMAPI